MLYRRLVLPASLKASRPSDSADAPGAHAFLRIAFLPANGVGGGGAAPEACLSLAAWGDMRYLEGEDNPRRSAFFSFLGLEPSAVRGTELYHTRRVLLETGDGSKLFGSVPLTAGSGTPPAGSHDGILLRDTTKAACITVADCMPIWIFDRHSGSFGVLHSGWKGTGILAVAVGALSEEFGSSPEAISVILGPAIGSCCYAVPPERARAFAAEFGTHAVREGGGRAMLDLRAANVALARRLGVGALLSVEACTACDSRLGSFRREGPETFTRMAAVAAILPDDRPSGCLVTPAPTL